MKLRTLCLIVVLCAASAGQSKQRSEIKEENIAGIPVKVLSEYRSSFKTQFVTLVIAEESYSKENLISIWRHYCAKYDKKDRLDLRVYVNRTYEYNRQFDGWPVNMHTGEAYGPDGTIAKLRDYEAYFERKGDGVLAYGGDNELMIYSPKHRRTRKEREHLVGGQTRQ